MNKNISSSLRKIGTWFSSVSLKTSFSPIPSLERPDLKLSPSWKDQISQLLGFQNILFLPG